MKKAEYVVLIAFTPIPFWQWCKLFSFCKSETLTVFVFWHWNKEHLEYSGSTIFFFPLEQHVWFLSLLPRNKICNCWNNGKANEDGLGKLF